MPARRRFRTAVLLLSTAAACRGVGVVEAPGPGRPPPASHPSVDPGGIGGTAGMPDDPPPPAAGPPVPGRVTLHRLNRLEYDNTIRDLVGVDLRPSRAFAFLPDDWGEGFDNNADVLTLSDLDVEKYLAAAREVAARALDPAGPARARLLGCDPAADDCGRRFVLELGRRAFRRPVTAEEMAPYLGLVDLARQNGDDVERGLRLVVQALLVAPDFLFRVELDPEPGVAHALSDFELASRLSYFLWSSMPDEELFAAAGAHALGDAAALGRQVARMLADPRAGALADNLVGQWLETLKLTDLEIESAAFPAWDEPLRAALGAEARQLFATVLAGDEPLGALLTARFTFANRRLGQHYGLPGTAGLPADRLTRVDLPDDRRGGILRGAFLALTSHSNIHSPTKRGKWVLERLLCRPPPPPPGNIPNFEPTKVPTGTLREKLEQAHEKRGAVCASCHELMDPVGFAFEHYDATGAWRDDDGGHPIDATGTLPDSDAPFDGAAALAAAVEQDPRFLACATRKVLTYALGRGLTAADDPAVADIAARLAAGGGKLPALVALVAGSVPMTMRKGEVTP